MLNVRPYVYVVLYNNDPQLNWKVGFRPTMVIKLGKGEKGNFFEEYRLLVFIDQCSLPLIPQDVIEDVLQGGHLEYQD